MSYSIFSVAVAIIILTILGLFSFFRKLTPSIKNRIFTMGIYTCLLTAILDLLALLTSSNHLPQNNIFSCLYYIGIGSTGLTFLLITVYLINYNQKISFNLKFLCGVPLGCFIVSVFIEFFNSGTFSYLTIGQITNNYYCLLFLVHFAYLSMCVLLIIFKFRQIATADKIFLFTYPTMVFVNLLMELNYSELHTTMLIVAIADLYLFIYVQSNESLLDSLTKLLNKEAFENRISYLIKKEAKYKVYMIRLNSVNRLKSNEIQNKYIGEFADQLKQIYVGKLIYRYSFNTFIIIDINNKTLSSDLIKYLNDDFYEIFPDFYYYSFDTQSNIKSLLDVETLLTVFNSERVNFHVEDHLITSNLLDLREKEMHLINLVKTAAAFRSVKVLYQPIIDIKTNKVISAEALMRLNVDEKVSPLEFIKIAEQIDVIDDLTYELLRQVGDFLNEINMSSKYSSIKGISVNLTPKQISSTSVQQYIMKLINRYQLKSNQLRLEITEDFISTNNKEKILKIVNDFKNKGILFYQDDFGTGYSDIRSLLDYGIPFNMIKIDKALVDYIDQDDSKSFIFLESLIFSLKALKYQIIVEGVERESQLNILKSLNISFVQGYYYSKPLELEDFKDFVLKQNEKSH